MSKIPTFYGRLNINCPFHKFSNYYVLVNGHYKPALINYSSLSALRFIALLFWLYVPIVTMYQKM